MSFPSAPDGFTCTARISSPDAAIAAKPRLWEVTVPRCARLGSAMQRPEWPSLPSSRMGWTRRDRPVPVHSEGWQTRISLATSERQQYQRVMSCCLGGRFWLQSLQRTEHDLTISFAVSLTRPRGAGDCGT